MSLLTRFVNVFRSGPLDRDLDEEFEFHLQSRIDDLVRTGMARAEAEQQARRRFGGKLQLRESSRDAKLLPWLESLLQDVRFGTRMLWKHRFVTAAAIMSLSLAAGASTAAFSLIDALLLRPLPVRNPDSLVFLDHNAPGESRTISNFFSHPLYENLSGAAGAYVDLFEVGLGGPLQTAIFDDSAGQEEKVRAEWFSGNAFPVLGIKSELGRVLAAADDRRPAAVLSESFWRRHFGASPSVLGRWIKMNNSEYQIVGIAAKQFYGLEPGYMIDLWAPIGIRTPARTLADPYSNVAQIWGRLKPAVTIDQATYVIDAAYKHFQHEQMQVRPGPDQEGLSNRPPYLQSAARGGPTLLRWQFRRPFWIAGIIAALVLLIAGSNIANLLLARASARWHEMAMRVSIGASRLRLLQQLLLESALVAGTSCAVGLALASLLTPAIVSLLSPTEYPAYLDVAPDRRALAFVAALGVFTTLLFGLAPALRASAAMPNQVLESYGGPRSGRIGILRPMLTAQVAFSFAVLFIAGLLLLSFAKLTTLDLGFSKENVALLGIRSRQAAQRENTSVEMLQLLDRVRQTPGVDSAGMSGTVLLGGAFSMMRIPTIRIPGRQDEIMRPYYLEVSPGFFSTMRVAFTAGRDFAARDTDPNSSSVVVNQAFVRRYLGGAPALGKRFERIGGEEKPAPQEIIGVVRDFKYNNVREPATPTVYSPLRRPNAVLEVRAGNPLSLVPILREEIHRTNPALVIDSAALQSTRIDETLIGERLLALLAAFFALVAAVLAAIGIYGVLSYAVVRRTREAGIRIVLGARPRAIVWMLAADLIKTAGLGIAAGLAGGIALARFVSTLLFDVKPSDAASVALPLACLVLACSLAALAPALRAARIDPALALRAE